jgi:hypothetical protein
MKKLIILLIASLLFTYCKGPRSGPLVKESFTKESQPMAGQTVPRQTMPGQTHAGQVTAEKFNVVVEPCQGTTIASLLENKKSLSGKSVKVKGQVTKFNPAIMGKNWVHIQDGTEFQGGFDLTITTDIQVSVGETITIEGKIVLDKDFGYGYVYSVLMEEGKLAL